MQPVAFTHSPQLEVIQRLLENWPRTNHLSEEKTQWIASEIFKSLYQYSSENPTSSSLFAYPTMLDLGEVKGLCARTSEGAVIYLSSKVEGCIGHRKKISGNFKTVTQGLEIALKGMGDQEEMSFSLVALVKPKTREEEIVNEFKKEANLLHDCKDVQGVVQLKNVLEYSKGENQKVRMVLPWYQGDLIDVQHGLSSCEKMQVCRQLLETVAALEKKGRVCRDIKGDNILIDRGEGGVINMALCDLGLMYSSEDSSVPLVAGCGFWLAPEYSHLVAEVRDLEQKKEKIMKWTTSKLDVWGAGMICAALLKPAIWRLFEKEKGWCNTDTDFCQAGNQWYDSSCIPGMDKLYRGDPVADLIKKMLHPRPEHRLSASESLEKFISIISSHL